MIAWQRVWFAYMPKIWLWLLACIHRYEKHLKRKVLLTPLSHVCLHSSLSSSRRRLPPATPSSSLCSWMRISWWAASPRPCTPCSAPTCCPTSRREAGTWRKQPPSCWRPATGPRRAPCCWLTAEPTGPRSPSTLPWPFSGSGCERGGGGEAALDRGHGRLRW